MGRRQSVCRAPADGRQVLRHRAPPGAAATFGVASVAISLAFFSLFGAAFATTLYLQFAHGYSALQAGAAMSPLALGLIVGAGSGAKLSARFGTTRVVAAGLAGLGLLELATLAWTPGIAYWPLGL